jgi:four helix bundle protein
VLQRRELQREFKLRDQLSSAAEGPCGHIAEGFSRWFPNDFARFVRIAKGSLSEVIVHIGAARDRGLVTDAECQDINRYARRARGAATALFVTWSPRTRRTRNRTTPGGRIENAIQRRSHKRAAHGIP